MSDVKRQGHVQRTTKETTIDLRLALDGRGQAQVQTGLGFFDHMLTALARHGGFDLALSADGDLKVDGHHTVEDVGLCFGQALADAVGSGAGLVRFGQASIPMDEALVEAVIDVSGRPFLVYDLELAEQGMCGSFDPSLAEEFFRALVSRARITVHLRQLAGRSRHHVLEAAFKAFGRALCQSVTVTADERSVLSTKGTLDMGKDG